MRTLLAGIAVVFAATWAGCNCATKETSCSTPNCAAVDGGGGGDAGPGSIVSIAVTPANDTLTLTVGQQQSLQYIAIATFANGRSGAVAGNWSLSNAALGSIDPMVGLFTANGSVGGVTQVVFAASAGGSGTTSLTIDLTAVIFPTGSNPPPQGLFADAGTPVTDPTAQAQIAYPLDNVMFPQNVNAPVVQWNTGGGPSDWYRVTYAKPHISVVDYVQNAAGFTFSEQLPDAVFSRIAETDPTTAATLTVDRLDLAGARVIAGPPVHLSFARGSVSGTVYFWVLDEARLHRIPGGTTNNQTMFANGITGTAATDPGYTYTGCIACHQISRDGRYLAASGLDANGQAFLFDLTAGDPTQPNMPVATRAGYGWYFASISPDDTRIFATSSTATFSYTDLSVKSLTPTGTVPSANVAHPSWSPDGKTVAFISNVAGWASNASFTGGDLTVVNVDAGTDVFSNLQVIHQGASLATSDPAGGNADCFPSWTPDSKYLMFAHTQNTRGTGAVRYDGSLYILPPRAAGTPVRLAAASDSTGHALSHFPASSPFISGGFYWIVFYSTRDYGNALAGTAGTNRPQLWVSAISTSFDGVNDPSSVPYWLPGQSTAHQNADAQWAASACKPTGQSCATSSDCCSGTCQAQGDGGYACGAPTSCRREGESCSQDSDCCQGQGLQCNLTIHTCQLPFQ